MATSVPDISLLAGHAHLVSQMAVSVPDLSEVAVLGPSLYFPDVPGSSLLEERSGRQKREGWQESHLGEGGRGVWRRRRRRRRRKRLVKGERDHGGGAKVLEPLYQDVPPEAGDGAACSVTVTYGHSPASYTIPILPGQKLRKSPGMFARINLFNEVD